MTREQFTKNFSQRAPDVGEMFHVMEPRKAYFTPWDDATSTLDISLTGFINHSDTFDLSGYHIEEVIMVEE